MTDTTASPPTLDHEPGDENNRTILITAGILAASVALSFVIAWALLGFFLDRENAEKQSKFPLAMEENRLPVNERLQRMPHAQPLLEGLKREDEDNGTAERAPTLDEYGPGDEKGFARIPISTAIDRMLAKDRFPVQGEKKP
jgi:hypothetical protein